MRAQAAVLKLLCFRQGESAWRTRAERRRRRCDFRRSFRPHIPRLRHGEFRDFCRRRGRRRRFFFDGRHRTFNGVNRRALQLDPARGRRPSCQSRTIRQIRKPAALQRSDRNRADHREERESPRPERAGVRCSTGHPSAASARCSFAGADARRARRRIRRGQRAGERAQFPDELLRLGRAGDRRFHFRFFRTGKFIERVGGQFRIVEIDIHEAMGGLNGMNSRAE